MEPVEQITPETTTVEPTVEPVAEPVTETVNEPVVEVIEEKDVHPDAVVEEKKEEEETVKEEGEEQKKEGEEKAEEEVETWKMIGNVCLTPCGHGVLSTRTEDDRAGVLLIASEGKDKSTRLATGIFPLACIRKPTLEKIPTSLTILRAQVYRDLGDTLLNGEIYDKALFLYQTVINLISEDIEPDYQADALVLIVTSLTNMCTCFLAMQKLDQAEIMAKQAFGISPKYDKAAIAMATVLVAREKYQEALEVLKPAIEANPTVNGLKVIYNKVVEMYNEQQQAKTKERVAGSVLMNNFAKPKPSAGAAGAGAAGAAGAGQEMSQEQMIKEALAKMQAEANKPKTEEELAKEKEEAEKAAAAAKRNSMLWGVIGGAALVALLLIKKLHK